MSSLFAEIPRSSTSSAIEDQIKRLIVTRQLVAGDALPTEREFAVQLGVSRSTLREALRALTQEGMITARQGSGWVVQPNPLTAASNLAVYFHLEDVSFEQVVEARRTIEPTIARLAAERRTDEQLAAIELAVEAADLDDARAFIVADSNLHALVAAASQNPLLSFSMLPTMSLLEDVRVDVVKQAGSIAASQAEHKRIVAAIGARDGAAAETSMREHIEWFEGRGAGVAREVGR